jgi:hypothetical protein
MAMFETLARVMTGPQYTLKIRCNACDHRAEWGRQEAFDRLGADSSPYELRRKLICITCGERGNVSAWV